MNVPNIGQGPGSAATLPRARTDASVPTPPRPEAAGASARSAGPSPSISFTRLAWFDVNGDGHIDPRSASSGGDATLLVPAHGVDLPTWSRKVSSRADEPAVRETQPARSDEADTPPPVNVAQANRAADAYQRYGQTPPAPADTSAALASGAATGR